MKKPELLAPAGNLEKLKIAYKYGADACYTGGHVFGLRKFAENFSLDQLKEGIQLARDTNKRLLVVLNGFAHDEDLAEIKPYVEKLQAIGPDAFIISDIGVAKTVRELCDIPIHASTQASITNWYTCKLWKDVGAKRIVLAREVTLEECKKIKANIDIELEVFIHGAQCASYSGKCVISNYTSGRDSNRGGCVQSCRHAFTVNDAKSKESEFTTYIMNAKDMMSVKLIPNIIDAGIDSLKIEGRMKSNLYVASACKIYRYAIDYYIEHKSLPQISELEAQLSQVSNRGFSTGGLLDRHKKEEIHYPSSHTTKEGEFIGTIKESHPHFGSILEVKFPCKIGDTLEVISNSLTNKKFKLSEMFSMDNEAILQAKPNSLVRLPNTKDIEKFDIIRRPY